MNRLDYICCVLHTSAERKDQTWCGRDLSGTFEFAFTNIDHAAYASISGDRLRICPKCLRVIKEAFNGS